MRSFRISNYFLVVFSLCQIACATKSVTFRAEGAATVSLVSWDKLDSDGEKIGDTPLSVELSKVGDRVVKIAAEGKESQYWVFSDMLGTSLEAKVQLVDAKGVSTTETMVAQSDPNESHRLLMKAYQALSVGDTKLARGIAEQLNKIAPKVAASYIIDGLAALDEGQKDQARRSFSQAKTLDPKDAEIDILIKATDD